MKQEARRLKILGDICEMKLEAELAALARIAHDEQRLRDEIRVLDESAHAFSPDSQALAGLANHFRWLQWCRQQKARLNTQLAALKADRETLLHSARTAFGRTQALRSLERQARSR